MSWRKCKPCLGIIHRWGLGAPPSLFNFQLREGQLLREFIEEEPRDAGKNEYLRIINTGTIGKFVSKWGQREMVYLGCRFVKPVVNKRRFLAAFHNTYGRKAVKPKLVVKGLNLLDACLDADGTTIPGKTTLIITSDGSDKLMFLLAIINSSVAFFYLREKYPASSYNQGTTFTKEMVNDLPIPHVATNDRSKLASLVERIINIRRANPVADVTALEHQMNDIVAVLYGLTPLEMQVVDHA